MSTLLSLVRSAQKDTKQMAKLLSQFEPLIRKYARMLHRLEPEDAMQEMSLAFLQIIQKLDLQMFDGPEPDKFFLSYLQRAMKSRFLDLVKRQNNIIFVDLDNALNLNQEDGSLSPEELAELREMLASLTGLQREVILAKYLYGYSDVEIAGRLHVSRQAVNRAKNRAVALLKEKYR